MGCDKVVDRGGGEDETGETGETDELIRVGLKMAFGLSMGK